MNNLKLVGSRGINKKSRGIMESGEMRLEINWGLKCRKTKIKV